MLIEACLNCGGPMPPYVGRGRHRKFCGNCPTAELCSKAWRDANPERVAFANLARRQPEQDQRPARQHYGLTRGEVARLRELQGDRCAICGTTSDEVRKLLPRRNGNLRVLDLDHDHRSEFARGLLCPRCNTGLGKFKDDVELLQQAIAYLNAPPVIRLLEITRRYPQ